MDFPTTLASSGITGAVVASIYIAYKCFYKKKLKSKCCLGEMSIEEPQQTITITPQLQPDTSKEEPRDIKV
jgi:hypothetical protein